MLARIIRPAAAPSALTKPTGHRHLAEVQNKILGVARFPIHFAVTAIEMVRGVHLLAHCYLREAKIERDIWRLYRGQYRAEPFHAAWSVARVGLHRLAGTAGGRRHKFLRYRLRAG